MTFKNWIQKNYRYGAGTKTDLAHDISHDGTFPSNGEGKFDGWRALIRSYLELQGACDGCLEAFDEAWEEYELCERKRLNKS